jgi:glutamate--cysteine ligase catalytic subunit
LFIRDPLVIFSDRVQVKDEDTTEHFENIQSTNWQTMRWKPPPLNAPMGWRVEFRPMEVQFTDFENAAFTVVVMLLARVILFFDLVFYIPLSKVDENMRRAHAQDAVLKQKFFFRKHLVPLAAQCGPSGVKPEDEDEFEEMSIEDILMGRGDSFPGLVPLIWGYLDVIQVDQETRGVVDDYIDLVVKRAKGELPTPAKWMRDFYVKHPDYKHDSVVSELMAKDLVEEVVRISHGEKQCPELLGQHVVCKLSEAPNVRRVETRLQASQPLGKALRGSSFHKDVGTTQQSTFQCALVRALVEKYAKNNPVNPSLKESILVEGRGFDQSRALFKRSKTMASSS